MKLHQIVVAVLLVGLIIAGFTTFFNELKADHSLTGDFNELNQTDARLDLIANQTVSMQQNISEIKIDDITDIFTVPYNLLSAAWGFAKITINNVKLVEEVAVESTTVLEVRGISDGGIDIKTYVMAALYLLVVAIFVYAAFKWKFED